MVFSNDDIAFGDTDSDIVTYFSNHIGLNSINLNNINLDKDDFDDYVPENINQIRLMTWYNKFKQPETRKTEISKKVRLVAWHPARQWDQ